MYSPSVNRAGSLSCMSLLPCVQPFHLSPARSLQYFNQANKLRVRSTRTARLVFKDHDEAAHAFGTVLVSTLPLFLQRTQTVFPFSGRGLSHLRHSRETMDKLHA